MILVDTSIWIDHLRRADRRLEQLLESGDVVCHPFVIGEIACGSLAQRQRVLGFLAQLPQLPVAQQSEAMWFLDRHGYYARGLGWVDVHLLASASIAMETWLWSRNRRLAEAAADLGIDGSDAGT